jgi:phosphate transport system ATP-binding protein
MTEATPGNNGSSALVPDAQAEVVSRNFNFYYGKFHALTDVNMIIPHNQITVLIGSSGCGKSTFLRAINRMHDRIPGARAEGELLLRGDDINKMKGLVDLRKRVGMIFQRPNPFPMSIFENVAYGLRLEAQHAPKSEIEGRVEQALKDAALWDDVKDDLKKSGMALSGGQQQRLCIARAIVVRPEVLLMDEPTSALDPISTGQIEDLAIELKKQYTVVIVSHNMQQASRISDCTGFFSVIPEVMSGYLVEFGATKQIFTNPKNEKTNAYLTGRSE